MWLVDGLEAVLDVAALDRVDEAVVVGRERLGRVRLEHLRIEQDRQPRVQRAHRDRERRVVRGVADAEMEAQVEVEQPVDVPGGEGGLHLRRELAQRRDLLVRRAQRRAGDREVLDLAAQGDDLVDLVAVDRGDAGAGERAQVDQPLVVQRADRVADGSAARAEPRRDVALHDPLAGRDRPRGDHAPQLHDDAVAEEAAPFAGLVVGRGRHGRIIRSWPGAPRGLRRPARRRR